VTRDKASKQKTRILAARAWCNQLLFKLITIFNNCIIVKSYKMDRMTIAERARAVEILVSELSLRQQLLTLSQYLSRLQYFMTS
jgi:uncharacterized protein YlxW (UPF0749 family)